LLQVVIQVAILVKLLLVFILLMQEAVLELVARDRLLLFKAKLERWWELVESRVFYPSVFSLFHLSKITPSLHLYQLIEQQRHIFLQELDNGANILKDIWRIKAKDFQKLVFSFY